MRKAKYLLWFVEFICITGIAIILSKPQWSQRWLVIPVIVIIVLKFFEYKITIFEDGLKVHAQLNLLYKVIAFNDNANVRCTYHVPAGRWRLRQACDYIPAGKGAGRSFSKKKGIIAKAYREKMALVENFQSDEEFRQRMILNYEYTQEDMKRITQDRRSYLCYPLVDENNIVLGLLYFDSSVPNTFTLSDSDPHVTLIKKYVPLIRDSIL